MMADAPISSPSILLGNNGDNTSSVIYYGICLSDVPKELDVKSPLVFTDKVEVLKTVKKYPGARFKAFLTKEEAHAFSTHLLKTIGTPPVQQIEISEKGSAFRAPKSQELVKLRKAIEKGNEQYFLSTVWSNPRYLIASGDTPTILQEGFHYTALHIAARHNQPVICKLLLNIIQDLKFLQLLYEDDEFSVQERRMEYLTDLYLNLPDKGLSETPLHFACKFGCVKVVEILMSYPACDRNHVNKYGDTARKIICDRCSKPDNAVKKKIHNLFEDRYFVPVLRSDDDSLVPVVGKPCTPEKLSLDTSAIRVLSPIQTPLNIRAIAGPMSPELASQFYKKWKISSSPVRKSISRSGSLIPRMDSGKGLERVGRVLAKELQVGWNEYWCFLNGWCNFSISDGLLKLEKHFTNVYEKLLQDNVKTAVSVLDSIYQQNNKTPEKENSGTKNLSSGTREDLGLEFSPITDLCMKLKNFHVSSGEPDAAKGIMFTEDRQRHFYIRNLLLNENDNVRRTLHFDSPRSTTNCNQTEGENNRASLRSDAESHVSSTVDESGAPIHSDNEEESRDVFYTPPHSPLNADSPLQTPEEIQMFFVTGSQLSKVDFDVLRALEDITVDPSACPLVYLWMEAMSQYQQDGLNSSFTSRCDPTSNSSFHSLPEYEKLCNSTTKAAQQCWTFPVKRKNHL